MLAEAKRVAFVRIGRVQAGHHSKALSSIYRLKTHPTLHSVGNYVDFMVHKYTSSVPVLSQLSNMDSRDTLTVSGIAYVRQSNTDSSWTVLLYDTTTFVRLFVHNSDSTMYMYGSGIHSATHPPLV